MPSTLNLSAGHSVESGLARTLETVCSVILL